VLAGWLRGHEESLKLLGSSDPAGLESCSLWLKTQDLGLLGRSLFRPHSGYNLGKGRLLVTFLVLPDNSQLKQTKDKKALLDSISQEYTWLNWAIILCNPNLPIPRSIFQRKVISMTNSF
jgi:hypothetical protein